MTVKLYSCALLGLEPSMIECEVDLSNQLPKMKLVGLPSVLTQESCERVRSAIENSNLNWPDRKITINLSPVHIPKWGSHFELPMALGILISQSSDRVPRNIFAIGELSLEGKIKPNPWIGVISKWLKEQILREYFVVVHPKDFRSLCIIDPTFKQDRDRFILSEDLVHVFAEICVRGKELTRETIVTQNNSPYEIYDRFATFRKIEGEEKAKVAALAAVAGRHSLLLGGAHGSGKSMTIRAILEMSEPISESQKIQREALLGIFSESSEHKFRLPVRFLQTSISRGSLEGSLWANGQMTFGEMSKAHYGILVMDEFLEFRKDVLEAFRQPLEEKVVRIQRAKFSAVLPCDFQLLASTNFCACGLWKSKSGICRCSKSKREFYQRKLSGPLVDRFDIFVTVGGNISIPNSIKDLVEYLLDEKNYDSLLSSTFPSQTLDQDEAWRSSRNRSRRSNFKSNQLGTTFRKILPEYFHKSIPILVDWLREEVDEIVSPPSMDSSELVRFKHAASLV